MPTQAPYVPFFPSAEFTHTHSRYPFNPLKFHSALHHTIISSLLSHFQLSAIISCVCKYSCSGMDLFGNKHKDKFYFLCVHDKAHNYKTITNFSLILKLVIKSVVRSTYLYNIGFQCTLRFRILKITL